MTALPHQTDVKAANVSSTVLSTSGRRPWALTKEPERLTASQQVERGGADPQLTASETGLPPSRPIISSLPAGQSSVQARPTTLPPPPVNPAPTTTTPSTTSPSVPSSLPVDPQSAEMHSAAEKARLRRLAEEAEREATAGRARRKAKELEERLGLKSTAPETKAVEASSAPAVPPGAAKTSTPAFTLATRPKLAADIPQPVTSSMQAASTIAGLPPRPAGDQRVGESSWRARLMGENPKIIDGVPGSSREQANPAVSNERPARPTAESFFESQSDAHPSRDGLPGNSLVGEAPAYAPPPISDPSDALNPAPESNVTYSIDAEQSFLPKKESNFDSMLARIQAAMAEARERSAPPSSSPLTAVVPTSASKTEEELHPETLQGPGRISTAPRAAFTSAALPISPQPPSKLTIIPAANLRPEFFDVSQPLPPPSPPPAWRTYAVRLPKPETTKSPLAGSRLRAFESTSKPPPDGWLMTFEPPIDQLSPFSLSRAELLLPQPMQRRFSKHADMGPLVSISPRRLELYQKRIKRKVSNVPRPLEVFVPSTAAESLLMSATTTPAVTATSQQSRSQHPMSFDNRWQEDVRTKAADAADTLPRSPLRTSPTRAQMDGISKLDMTMNGQPDRGRMPLDVKPPGVRFMVSSELEGDSLLDEVNKMSLESVGEGEDKGNELARENESKTPGTEVSILHTGGGHS